jgi:acyl carrier protein
LTDVPAALRAVVALHLEVDPSELNREARLLEDLSIDSLTAIELAMVLEDEFDIALPEEIVAHVCTYGEMVDVVVERVTSAP